LHIRVEDIGRKGECRHCGYQFRPTLKQAVEQPVDALGGGGAQRRFTVPEPVAASALISRNGGLGPHLVPSNWAGAAETSGADLAVETIDTDQIVLEFDDPPPPSTHFSAPAHEPVAVVRPARLAVAVPDSSTGTGTELFQFEGEVPVVAPAHAPDAAGITEQIVRLVLQRDEALAECARLRHVVERLQSELGQQLSEVSRLQKSAERLKAVRAERDRLNAERALLVRETAGLQKRLVETQVALVEVEDELDEARGRVPSPTS
jgi:hypothetical protein